ncbi:MAG: VCBS repeat-containing protein, partial [Acidobacteriaceae bacterium]|nr:VCBS repeat-containing protein [Acidobacteriaceae bacterium]
MSFSRRDFLIRCTAATGVAFGPATDRPLAAGVEFHLQPHYREQSPLESVLHKRSAAFDDFVLEKSHDEIAAILNRWSEGLCAAGGNRTRAIEESLAEDFLGPSLQPSSTKVVRKGPALTAYRVVYGTRTAASHEPFVRELRAYLNELPRIVTAEFQVTSIEESSERGLLTEIRYELVGSGPDLFREQRSGNWHLEWQKATSGGYRVQKWQVSDEMHARSTAPLFEDVTAHALGRNPSYSEQLLHGVDYWRTVLDGASRIDIYGHNGVSVADIDGDGLDDLYVCQPAGLPNRLYRNRGDGTFEDITEASGVGVLENTACALFADFNNSSRQDLIVVRSSGPLLFVNEGNGKFRPKPDAFRFSNDPQGTFTGAAVADYDRDGWLDIYFCLYVYYQGAGQYKYPTPYYDANNGPPNFLMRNNRDGTFRDVTAESGLNRNNTRYSFCCAWTDSNGDGWPDLYVVNDFGRKNLYRNNGDGTFTDVAAEAGVEDVGAGMSVCSFDYDNDGAEDLYVADMWTAAGERITGQAIFRKNSSASVRELYRKHAMGNSLFRNAGKGRFADKTSAANVGMGRWSWSSDAWDFDHDGFSDLYVTNGMISGPIREDLNGFFWRQVIGNSPDEAKPSQAYEQGWSAINELIREDYTWSGFERNVFYGNNGDGTFSDVSGAIGLDFIEDGRAFALADMDGDGRLEMFLKNRNGPQLRLLKNVMKDLPSSISFRLQGTKSNRDAIGAVITLETNVGRQMRRLQAGSGFLSQHTKEVFFGLGDATGSIRATIRWPSGAVQTVENLPADHRINIEEGVTSFRAQPFRRVPAPTSEAQPAEGETLPDSFETWLLSSVPAPDPSGALSKLRGKPVLLYLDARESTPPAWASRGLELITMDLSASDDTAAIYNLLYRSLFDRHRDLSLPTSLLINTQGEIVKIYRGPFDPAHVERDCRSIPDSVEERIARALPFASSGSSFEFGRNYLSLGSVFFQRGYFEQAGAWFQLALKDDPSSSEAQYGLGSVYLKQSKAAEARASFEQAVKLNANYPETKPNAWNNLGLLATEGGRLDDAIGYFKQALRINPDHLISLLNLGNAYRQEKRWDEARSTLEHALQVGPYNPEVNYSLGMVFAQIEQPDRAYELLQNALQLRPNYPEAMNNLGVLYLRTRRRDQAVAEFETCIKTAPEFDQSYLNLARVYLIQGDREKA